MEMTAPFGLEYAKSLKAYRGETKDVGLWVKRANTFREEMETFMSKIETDTERLNALYAWGPAIDYIAHHHEKCKHKDKYYGTILLIYLTPYLKLISNNHRYTFENNDPTKRIIAYSSYLRLFANETDENIFHYWRKFTYFLRGVSATHEDFVETYKNLFRKYGWKEKERCINYLYYLIASVKHFKAALIPRYIVKRLEEILAAIISYHQLNDLGKYRIDVLKDDLGDIKKSLHYVRFSFNEDLFIKKPNDKKKVINRKTSSESHKPNSNASRNGNKSPKGKKGYPVFKRSKIAEKAFGRSKYRSTSKADSSSIVSDDLKFKEYLNEKHHNPFKNKPHLSETLGRYKPRRERERVSDCDTYDTAARYAAHHIENRQKEKDVKIIMKKRRTLSLNKTGGEGC